MLQSSSLREHLSTSTRCIFFFLLLQSLLRLAHGDYQAENFAPRNDGDIPGSTALQPHPSDMYQHLEATYPFLIPFPEDRNNNSYGSKWPNCAWQVATEPSASSFGLLDLNAYYHTLVIWDFDDEDVYRISGEFPAMRYFSIQSYEFTNGKPIASMLDQNITPKTGKNPQRDPTATPEERGTFEIYLTKAGTHGYPNELRVKQDGQKVNVVAIIYRIYDRDISTYASPYKGMSKKQQFWGFTEPAVVERLRPTHSFSTTTTTTAATAAAKGGIGAMEHLHPKDHLLVQEKKTWEEYPPCTDFGSALFQAVFSDLYPIFKHFPATPASCPMAKLSPDLFRSMILFGAGLEKGYAASITSYTNYDTRYLYWCAQESHVGHNLVIRMQGKLPQVPRGLYQHPRVSQSSSYDARYISISTIDMLYPSPTYQEYKDHDIERFYSQDPDWDRSYSIIFAIDPSIPQACHMYNSNTDLFLGWKDSYNYGLEPTRMPSIVYRELLPTLKEKGGRGKSLADVNEACLSSKTCADGNVIRSVMQETYPQIDVWICDVDAGIATRLA